MRFVAAVLFAMIAMIALTLAPRVANAQSLSDADGAAIREVIQSQLEAFKRDDGTAAYSFAAPNIQLIFPSVDSFMGMVRKGYEPVYRPRSYSFQALQTKDGVITQSVEIVGPDGTYWTAEYVLVRQPDGSWKIAACRLIRTEGGSA